MTLPQLVLLAAVAGPPDEPSSAPDGSDASVPAEAAAAAAWYFERERWAEAAAAFERAHAEDPDPRYLYALGQALRFDGRCDEAEAAYRRYLEVATDEEGRRYAQANLERCQAAPEADEPTAPPDPAPVVAQSQAPEPVRDVAPRRPGAGLLAGGGAALGIGTALTVAGAVIRGRADATSETEDAFGRRLVSGAALLGTGFGLAAVGAALVVAGAVRRGRAPARIAARPLGVVVRF